MNRLFLRTPHNCAIAFHATIAVFLAHLLFLVVTILSPHWTDVLSGLMLLLSVALTVAYLFAFGLLAHQLGYHPVVVALICVALFLPFANFVLFFVLFFHGQNYLRKEGYALSLFDARPGSSLGGAVRAS
jgi:hypothetical protein